MRIGLPFNVAIAIYALAAMGCQRTDPSFSCSSNDDCSGGVCESTQFCSFGDGRCDSGRRYGGFSGGLSNTCVPTAPVDDDDDDPHSSSSSTTSQDSDQNSSQDSSPGSDPDPDPDPGDDPTLPDTWSTSGSTSDSSEETGPMDMEFDVPPVPGECPTLVTIERDVIDATIAAPMSLRTIDGVTVAGSLVSNSGSVTFDFPIDCSGFYRVFGYVYDDVAGGSCCDPDSFFVQAPGGVDTLWSYGCDTITDGFSWVEMTASDGARFCSQNFPLAIELQSGVHSITFTNREAGDINAFAAIASVIITNDLDFVP